MGGNFWVVTEWLSYAVLDLGGLHWEDTIPSWPGHSGNPKFEYFNFKNYTPAPYLNATHLQEVTVSHTETAENPAPILIHCFMGTGNGEHLEIWGRGLLQYINSKWLFPVKLTVGLNHFLLLQFAIEPFCKFSLKNFSFQVDTGKVTVFVTLLLEHIFYIHDSSVLIIILNVFSNWSPNLL